MAAIVAVALLAWLAWCLWRNPFMLIRAEFTRQRIALGLKRRSLVVDGQRWVYAERDADHGDARTMLMLHGYTGSKENWYPLARRLRGRFRLLIPDLPG